MLETLPSGTALNSLVPCTLYLWQFGPPPCLSNFVRFKDNPPLPPVPKRPNCIRRKLPKNAIYFAIWTSVEEGREGGVFPAFRTPKRKTFACVDVLLMVDRNPVRGLPDWFTPPPPPSFDRTSLMNGFYGNFMLIGGPHRWSPRSFHLN